jgi:hypothetical protein
MNVELPRDVSASGAVGSFDGTLEARDPVLGNRDETRGVDSVGSVAARVVAAAGGPVLTVAGR